MSTRKRKIVPFSELPFSEQIARADRLARAYRYSFSIDPQEWPFVEPGGSSPFDVLHTTPYTLSIDDVKSEDDAQAVFARSLDYAQGAYVYGFCVGRLHRR